MLGVWPLIMGVTMWFQMKLNPAPPDPTQKMIFDWMLLIFTFMLASFSAGLVIYWAWNNTLSVLQQSIIMHKHGAKIELFDNIKAMLRKERAGGVKNSRLSFAVDLQRTSSPSGSSAFGREAEMFCWASAVPVVIPSRPATVTHSIPRSARTSTDRQHGLLIANFGPGPTENTGSGHCDRIATARRFLLLRAPKSYFSVIVPFGVGPTAPDTNFDQRCWAELCPANRDSFCSRTPLPRPGLIVCNLGHS
jgi:hypothetical protein